jgi:hypothetical protein
MRARSGNRNPIIRQSQDFLDCFASLAMTAERCAVFLPSLRGAEGDAAIQIKTTNMRRRHRRSGLLRYARNDGGELVS